MERCPVCRAQLNGADVCRRCRADLTIIKDIARRSEAKAEAAMHCLALGETAQAARLLSRAQALHATPEVAWMLSKLDRARGREDEPHRVAGDADERSIATATSAADSAMNDDG